MELFLREAGHSGYFEFNFSPSTAWAAYRFSGYRNAIEHWQMASPEIRFDGAADCFTLTAALENPFSPRTPLDIGVTAVIHEQPDRKSYWSLQHPYGKPDFHHPDCFAARLAAASRA